MQQLKHLLSLCSGLTLLVLSVFIPSHPVAASTTPMDRAIDAYGWVTGHPATLVWEADDCGCTPISAKKRNLGTFNKVTYGFFPLDMPMDVDETVRTKTAKIKFSRINRIGYYALVSNDQGGFPHVLEWEQTRFKKTAARYNSQVDLAVAFGDGKTAFFKDSSKHRALAREITDLVTTYEGKGVTIDFRFVTQDEYNGFLNFITYLDELLQKWDRELFLNLFCDFNAPGSQLGRLTLDQAAGLQDRVDLFLIMVQAGNPSATREAFLTLSTLIDRHNLKQNNLLHKRRILPVFSGANPDNQAFFVQILNRGYGGIGLWPEEGLGDQETKFISQVFHDHPIGVDTAKRLFNTFCPGCCDKICPNRFWFEVFTYTLGLMLLIYYLLSRYYCELRTFAREHAKWFITAFFLFLGLFTALSLCIPFLQGFHTEVFMVMILIAVIYVVGEEIRKRREAKRP